MKRFYAYIRVSTTKQGERSSSLQEQRSAIEAYAHRNGLRIEQWFEEQETAAKRGRRLFNKLLTGLGRGNIDGVIIHKIDRGARNLRDWADLGELIDSGIEVHFAHESIDLSSRGGRLSADIQAVVAADYIRNLRDEVIKGFYGRLKQGLYPLPAPLGYRDEGGGRPKSIDPITGPFIRLAFELYATGRYNLEMLANELYRRGLRTKRNRKIAVNHLSKILNNQFYIGIIRISRTGEQFQGVHQPLINPQLFRCVKSVLNGRAKNRGLKHEYPYRKAIRCKRCTRVLVPETHKGYTYYRCHERTTCKGVSVRAEVIDAEIKAALRRIRLTDHELKMLEDELRRYEESADANRVLEQDALQLKIASIESRLGRLTDAYVDRVIDKDIFQERKETLLNDRAMIKDTLAKTQSGEGGPGAKLKELFEHIKSLGNKDELLTLHERRDLIKSVSSNLLLDGKNLTVAWKSPLDVIAARGFFSQGGPHRDTSRTYNNWAKRCIEDYINKFSSSKSDEQI